MNKFYPGEEKPPVFLLTNSMGGMIALNILMRKNESRL
jgi:alpha-beta hydrolase superfamily lysophospholipase